MGRWLAVIILIWPLMEIAGLVWLSDRIGLATTLVLVAAGFLAGFALLHRTGLQALQKLRLAMERDTEPGHTLIDAACFTIAGALLIVPGPISDVAAIVLMLPWTRDALLRWVARHFDSRVNRRHSVIKGEYMVVNEDLQPRPTGGEPRIEHNEDQR